MSHSMCGWTGAGGMDEQVCLGEMTSKSISHQLVCI